MTNLPIADHATIQRNPNIVFSDIDGDIVIMSIDSGKYYGIDETGSQIWELLATPKSFAELCEQLMTEFNVDATQCRQDVSEFIADLKAQHLIEVSN